MVFLFVLCWQHFAGQLVLSFPGGTILPVIGVPPVPPVPLGYSYLPPCLSFRHSDYRGLFLLLLVTFILIVFYNFSSNLYQKES